MTSPITLSSVTNPDGSVDMGRLAELVEVAEQMRVALAEIVTTVDAADKYDGERLSAEEVYISAADYARLTAGDALTRASAFVVAAATDEVERPPSWPFEPSAEDLARDFNPDEGRDVS